MNPGLLASQESRPDSIHQPLSGWSLKDQSVTGFTQSWSKTGHKCSKCSKCVLSVFVMCLPTVHHVFAMGSKCSKCVPSVLRVCSKCILSVF